MYMTLTITNKVSIALHTKMLSTKYKGIFILILVCRFLVTYIVPIITKCYTMDMMVNDRKAMSNQM